MAIRLRTVTGIRVALCAAETDATEGDMYLDDGDHYALAAKFSQDWDGQIAGWPYPVEWAAMDTQKKRDAKEELNKFLDVTNPEITYPPELLPEANDPDTAEVIVVIYPEVPFH